jgi:hypothetical protein
MTADKNLAYQKNLTGRRIGILVLPTNKLKTLRRIAPAIRAKLDSMKAGDFIEMIAD